jgi:hypothetical protein
MNKKFFDIFLNGKMNLGVTWARPIAWGWQQKSHGIPWLYLSTRDRGRTDTILLSLVFETSASTNSATRANRNAKVIKIRTGYGKCVSLGSSHPPGLSVNHHGNFFLHPCVRHFLIGASNQHIIIFGTIWFCANQ